MGIGGSKTDETLSALTDRLNKFYLTSDQIGNLYLTKSEAGNTYFKQDGIGIYLTQDDANKLYLSQNALDGYITRDEAGNLYVPKSALADYAKVSQLPDLSPYAKTSYVDKQITDYDINNVSKR